MAKPGLNAEVLLLVAFMPLGLFLLHLVFMCYSRILMFVTLMLRVLCNVYVLSKIQKVFITFLKSKKF